MEDIVEVPGIGARTAQAIVDALAGGSADERPAVNATTGEVLE